MRSKVKFRSFLSDSARRCFSGEILDYQCVPSKMRMTSKFPGKKVRWLRVVGVVLILLLHFLSQSQGQVDGNYNGRRTVVSSRSRNRNEEDGQPQLGPRPTRARSKSKRPHTGRKRDKKKPTPPPSPPDKKKVVLAVIMPWYGLNRYVHVWIAINDFHFIYGVFGRMGRLGGLAEGTGRGRRRRRRGLRSFRIY